MVASPIDKKSASFVAGSQDDPAPRIVGLPLHQRLALCKNHKGVIVHCSHDGNWLDDSGHFHKSCELEILSRDADQKQSPESQFHNLVEDGIKVERRVTEKGYTYHLESKQFGPYLDDETTEFDDQLATKFGVTNLHIMKARMRSITEEISLDRLNEILGVTVKRDDANKSITALNMLLAQTDEDQFNVGFQAESSTGKSYIPLELLEYFPDSEKRTYAGASPTNFYHEVGQWRLLSELAKESDDLRGIFDQRELEDKKRKVIVVNLANKNLVFLDQPHWSLLEKLRPLLSHDKKILRYSITDKMGKGGLRSKTVIIIGYCSVFFCTTKPSQDDQERTRLTLLSPEASQEKIREALALLADRLGNRKAFRAKIEQNPLRRWLKQRIRVIRDTGIKEIIVPNPEKVLDRFLNSRPHLAPRHQRDFPRLMCYIKGLALLNCFHRKRNGDTIEAAQKDIDTGFQLYELVAKPNEMGLSPETYRIYEDIIAPLAQSYEDKGIPRNEIVKKYLDTYGRSLSWEKLTKQVLPALESAGLVHQDKNPDDKRETLVYTPISSGISTPQKNTRDNRGVNRKKFDESLDDSRNIAENPLQQRKEILLRVRSLHFSEAEDYINYFVESGMTRKEATQLIEDATNHGVLAKDTKTGKFSILLHTDSELPELLRLGGSREEPQS